MKKTMCSSYLKFLQYIIWVIKVKFSIWNKSFMNYLSK